MCLLNLKDCPEGLKDDLRWEVQELLTHEKNRLRNLYHKMDNITKQRHSNLYVIDKKTEKRIWDMENDIAEFLFDFWDPQTREEDIWREYFMSLYECTILDKVRIDISNIETLRSSTRKGYEHLKRPGLYQSQIVRIIDYKFVDYYNLIKNIKIPDFVETINNFSQKKIELTNQIWETKSSIANVKSLIESYEQLLSSSLC